MTLKDRLQKDLDFMIIRIFSQKSVFLLFFLFLLITKYTSVFSRIDLKYNFWKIRIFTIPIKKQIGYSLNMEKSSSIFSVHFFKIKLNSR